MEGVIQPQLLHLQPSLLLCETLMGLGTLGVDVAHTQLLWASGDGSSRWKISLHLFLYISNQVENRKTNNTGTKVQSLLARRGKGIEKERKLK